MPGQGRSAASSRSRRLSPRLTVSAGSQSQYSAYTVYSDVESDHNVFAFVPPPAGGAQGEHLDQPPVPTLLPVEEDPRPTTTLRFPTPNLNRRRTLLPSFGQFVRRLDTGSESSGPGTASRRTITQEFGVGRPELPSATFGFGGERGETARTDGSDVFNFAITEDAPSAIASDNTPSENFSAGCLGSGELEKKGNSLRYV